MVSLAKPEEESDDLHAAPFLVMLHPLVWLNVHDICELGFAVETRIGLAEMVACGFITVTITMFELTPVTPSVQEI